jgi:tRNA threonylcarbamoyl adenosine modification protein YeaZ
MLPFDRSSYALAIHTSSPELGLAISNFAGDTRSQVWELGRDLSTQLHCCLAEFLPPQTWNDLAFLAVAKGPGGFTGTRMGMVTARILAQQLKIPLFAISSLAAIAWEQRQGNGEMQSAIAVEMRAQRGELFTAIYQMAADQSSLNLLLPDGVMTPATWQQTLDGYSPCHRVRGDGGLGGSAIALLDLAYQDWQQGKCPHWSEVLPFYGQQPV